MLAIHMDAGNSQKLKRGALLCALLLIAGWIAYKCRDIWLPLLIAFVIALVLDPVVDRMEERGWKRAHASALIFCLFLIGSGVVLTLAVPPIVSQTIQLSHSLGQYLPSDSETQTKARLLGLMHKLHASGFVQHQVLRASAQMSHATANLGNIIAAKAGDIAPELIWVVLIPIVAFYILKDFHVMLARLFLIAPHSGRSTLQQTINQVSTVFVKYLRGLLIVCALNGVVTALVLQFAFHLHNAFALGAISGLLYTIPYLGPIMTIGITVGVAMMTASLKTALTAAVTLAILHSVIFDQIITPRVVGREVGLHPVFAIIALLIGGSLLGIVGMIVAVPLAATIQIVLGVLYPKMLMPIDVPTGSEMHALNPGAGTHRDEVADAAEAHSTIVQAVDYTDPDVTDAPPPGTEHTLRHGNADLS